MPVALIRNTQNPGFPLAINQGLQAASGEFLVLLNNDAVVTDGWLDPLIAPGSARVDADTEPKRSHAENAGERREEDRGAGWGG